MDYDKQLIKLNKTSIEKFEKTPDSSKFLFGFNQMNIGYFEWKYDKDILCINDTLTKMLNLELQHNVSVLEISQDILDKSSQFSFYKAIFSLIEGESSSEVEIPFRRGNDIVWYKLKMTHNHSESYIIGIFESIQDLKVAQNNVEGLSYQFDQVLESMPLPIYYYDLDGNILFTNRYHTEDFSRVNKIVEKKVHGDKINLEDYSWIYSLETTKYAKDHVVIRIKYEQRNVEKNSNIHRVEILQNSVVTGILYLHEDVNDFNSDEIKLNKIVKANELIIEIKDIVDHISDINSMYNYLLSKIHTVIPAAKRACVLNIDNDDLMYIAADYGFNQSYIETLSLPFKDSYAYTNLGGDYSKSVIIDDIQERYSTIHSEINENQFGFVIRSNITTPLVINGYLYGILSVDADETHVFDDVDLNLLDYLKLQIERAIMKFKHLKKVKRNSMIDPLTGVFNRRHLIDLLDQYIEDAVKLNIEFAFVIFDIDKLKKVNDSYGHVAGDQVIKQFTFIAEKEKRDIDAIARIGGDEFVGIFWDIDKETLIKKLSHWEELLSVHPIKYEGHSIHSSFSYGIAYYPHDGNSFESLLKVSDKKMYLQKK
jgi:diguanylate cyclase (GGDEF)-like protein